MKTYISLKVHRLIQYIKKNIYRDSKGFIPIVILGLIALGGVAMAGVAYVGVKTDTMLANARQNQNRLDSLANETIDAKNNPNYDPNKLFEKTKESFDFNKPPELPYPIDEATFEKYYKNNGNYGDGFSSLEEAQKYYQSEYLNDNMLENKVTNLFLKTSYYLAQGKWPTPESETPGAPLVEYGPKGNMDLLNENFMRQKEEKKAWEMYSAEQVWKQYQEWNEEDKDLLFEDAQGKRLDLIDVIHNAIEKQEKLEAEKAEIERIGLQNYWLKKAKEKMQQYGMLADEGTIKVREDYFKGIDMISVWEKQSPPSGWLPAQIALIEQQRKHLEKYDPLFSNNKLIAWLNRTGKEDPGIDFESIAALLKSMVTDSSEIAGETTPGSEESKGLTGATQPDETTPENTTDATQTGDTTSETNTQPTDTTPETNTQPTNTTPETTPDTVLPAELNLKGTMSTSDGLVYQLNLNINFETQIVSGTIAYSGPATWYVEDRDENGNSIPGTEKAVTRQTTLNGTINGRIDINSKIINANLSETASAYAEEQNKNVTESFTTTMLGTLWNDNTASGTTTDPSSWTASP